MLINFNNFSDKIGPREKPISSDPASSLSDFDVSKLKGLRMANLNVNSLLKHIDEIRSMISDYPFDILAINESKIDSLISNSEISIPDYSIVRMDRNRCGGAVVLYIKNNISYVERQDLVSDDLEMI